MLICPLRHYSLHWGLFLLFSLAWNKEQFELAEGWSTQILFFENLQYFYFWVDLVFRFVVVDEEVGAEFSYFLLGKLFFDKLPLFLYYFILGEKFKDLVYIFIERQGYKIQVIFVIAKGEMFFVLLLPW